MKTILIVLVIAAVGIGGYIYFTQPEEIPNIMVKAADGRQVDLDAMYQDHYELLLVFLLPGCPISQFSVGLVKEQYPEQFKSEQQIPFPVYGIRDATDPYAVNELIEKVGTSHGTRAAVYGGTIVVVNKKHKVLFKLEKDEIKQLPDKLAGLGY
jgi:hypothetical protein